MESNARLERQNKRRRQILSATLRLLRRHGTGISTAQIAAEANCSKETLYNWFEDRDGIFKALAGEQAAAMGEALERAFAAAGEGSFEDRLTAYCTALLDIMTGEAVVAVNRVAMAQTCHHNLELGEIVLNNWQSQVVAPFLKLFLEGTDTGEISLADPETAFDALTGLLIGDRQRRLLLGADARPDGEQMHPLAAKAVDRWLLLVGH